MKKNILNEPVKGFKGFYWDKKLNFYCKPYKGNLLKYPLNKHVTYNGIFGIKPCIRGLHFCKEAMDVDYFYSIFDMNTFVGEVVATGLTIDEGTKTVTDKLILKRIIPKLECLKSMGYKQKSGVKTIKNKQKIWNYKILYNTPDVLEDYKNRDYTIIQSCKVIYLEKEEFYFAEKNIERVALII